MKYSGTPPTRSYLLQIYKCANDPADRLDTIQDHRLFSVALIVFTQSVDPTETLGLCILVQLAFIPNRGAESESQPESELLGVVAAIQESESESEPMKLPWLRLRNVLFEYVV